jgi:hypothetical protein
VYSVRDDPPAGALILVSGLPSFWEVVALRYVGQEVLMIGTRHRLSKHLPPGPAQICLAHQSFGSPTHFVALFGCQGITCVPTCTVLRRNVGHIFEFGVQPDPLDDPELVLEAGGLTVNSILHLTDLSCPIVHRTSFFCTGWGLHMLSANELGIAFGFPTWLWAG